MTAVAELNSTPEPFKSIAMCMFAATVICLSFDLSKRLTGGKVIITKLWNRCKGQPVAAALDWVPVLWDLFHSAESG
ncbi:hypothetical protein ACFYRK_26175 [Streptomyces sp. NPDC005381]|uniref:hypothetical protein n=1 Tax=Streptomyces sp. NPDC005381 TaxID=3364714 RepID=UPI0036B53B9E